MKKDLKETAFNIVTGAIEAGLKNGLFGINDAKQVLGSLDILRSELFGAVMTVSKGGIKETKAEVMRANEGKQVHLPSVEELNKAMEQYTENDANNEG